MSQRTSPPQLAFSSGEISPLLYQRSDYQRFQTGLRSCNGFIPLRQGGVSRAPGTRYLSETHENRPARLLPFQFAANDTLVLELTDGIMRVWRDNALVHGSDDQPYRLALPYDLDAIERLQVVQSADVIYMADGVLPIQKLSRFALDDWTIEPLQLNSGPFAVQNLDEDLKIQASAAIGTITLTASAAVFVPEHEGALFRLEPEDFSSIPLWQQDTSLAANDLIRNDGKTYRITEATNTGFVPPVHRSGFAAVKIGSPAKWEFMDDGVGVVRILSVTSPTEATAEVIERLPRPVVDGPSYRWSEGAWSDRLGFPSCITIHDQRLVAAATPREPRTIWFSTIGDFEDFAPGAEADDAFAYTISGDSSQNRVQWLRSGSRGMYIGALGEEYSARSDARDQAIGPTTARFGLDSQIGSAAVQPIAPDGHPIFISRDRARIFEVRFVLEIDANRSVELSLPSEHLGQGGFRQLVWQSAPARLGWLVRNSGDLVVLIHDPQEDVLGWARCSVAGGKVLSVASVPSGQARYDDLMMVVAREIEGVTRHMIESQTRACGCGENYLYSARFMTLAPASHEFALPHLAGRDVMIWTQGRAIEAHVSSAGQVVLDEPVGQITVGLFDAEHEVETLDIQATAMDGHALGRSKRLHAKAGIGFHDTQQGLVAAVERTIGRVVVGREKPLITLPVATPLTERFSGITGLDVPSGHASEVSYRLRPVGNASLTLTAIVPRVHEVG